MKLDIIETQTHYHKEVIAMKKMIQFYITVVLFMLFNFLACQTNIKNTPPDEKLPPQPSQPSVNLEQVKAAFEKMEEIGAGRNFFTAKIDLPFLSPQEYQWYAMVLDKTKTPIRKISGYAHHPNIENKSHLWFYFFLYAPGDWINHLPRSETLGKYTSHYITFIMKKDNETICETTIERLKEWGDEKSTLIADLPSPPGEIAGYLELKDYTFFAKGDFRKPEGFYFEGIVKGNNGEWNYFVPTSILLGDEPEPDMSLVSDRGWLELNTGRTHRMMEAVAPARPFIEGWWDGKGYFHPDHKKVMIDD